MKHYVILLFLNLTLGLRHHPVVKVEEGEIVGKKSKTSTGKLFYEFHEIPYAAPPIGDLRFAEPIPPKKWDGVRDGRKTIMICVPKYYLENDPRIFLNRERETEDCLHLHVNTPKLPRKNGTDRLLPVYVFIYGGMFAFGDPAAFNFQYFLDEDIVTVSMSFRSNTLGFLATDDEVIPGNIGLKDQLMALKWINKNIAQFGGDPSKVTIGGHSSGAILAGHHVISPKSKGLFRSAIIQSASPVQSISFCTNAREIAFMFGEALSSDFVASKNTSEDLLKLLRSLPVDVVAKTLPDTLRMMPLAWVPTLESADYKNAFISSPMHENIEKGNFNQVPTLIGHTDEEDKFYNVTAAAAMGEKNFSLLLDGIFNLEDKNIEALGTELKNIYIKTPSLSGNLTGLLKLRGELVFSMPVKIQAFLQSKFTDVYMYQFSYLGPINGIDVWKKHPNYKLKGHGNATHTDELPLLFNFREQKDIVPSALDLLIRKRMIKLWTNFIKYTDPTPEPDPLLQNVIWPTVKQESFQYLDISGNLTVHKDPLYFKEWMSKIDKYFSSPRYFY